MSIHSDTDGTYLTAHWGNPAFLSGATQVVVSFWLKVVGTIPAGGQGTSLSKSDFATGGWWITGDDATDTLGESTFGGGAGSYGSCINAPIGGQGWLHILMHLTTVSANAIRFYKNGVLDDGSPATLTNELVNPTSNLTAYSNQTFVKLAECAAWVATDGTLTSAVAQTLATALAAQTLPTAPPPVPNFYAPCRSDLVDVIGAVSPTAGSHLAFDADHPIAAAARRSYVVGGGVGGPGFVVG